MIKRRRRATVARRRRPARLSGRKTAQQSAHQKRFKGAAKKCKGKPLAAFQACMRRELRR